MNKVELENKVAVITGSSRGIGKATALTFAKEGYDVVVTGRKLNELKRTAKEIEQLGRQALVVRADVKKSRDVKNLVNKTIRNFKKVDILVNNAGIVVIKPLIETTEKEWDDVININLKGAYLCSKEVLPYMVKQKSGVIVNISSGAGKYGFENLTAYCSSKFGLVGLTESLAKEVRKYGIRVYAICPGKVATHMQVEFEGKEKYEFTKYFMIQPEKIANKVLELSLPNCRVPSGRSIEIYLPL